MSKTDTTRPASVIELDRTARRIGTGPDGETSVAYSGVQSQRGSTKSQRKEAATRCRQRDRRVLTAARLADNPETVDVPPIPHDKRNIGRHYR